MQPAWVLHSQPLGVFLMLVPDFNTGGVTGLWSCSGYTIPARYMPDKARAFETYTQATWFADMFDPPPPGLSIVEVKAVEGSDGSLHAPREQCVLAGLPAWIDGESDTFNTTPT